VALLAGCGSETSVVSTRDLEYVDGHVLDVHAPPDADTLPVVVLLHGAGVTRHHYEPFAERLAAAGAVAVNVDWDVLPDTAGAASEQIACAVRFARSRGAEFGGDPERVVLVGHSSAAPWATRVALVGDEYDGECSAGDAALADALALLAPSSVPGGWPWEHSLLRERPDLDVVVVHGDDDAVARPSFGRRTAASLSDAGHVTRLEIVPGGHFELVMIPPGATGDTEPGTDAADRTIAAILALVDEST
jgi:acetyl esterase/lipase